MAGGRWPKSQARRRHDLLLRSERAGLTLGVAGALLVGVSSTLAADTVLAYFLAALVAIVGYRVGARLALVAVPSALAAYRGTLDLAWRGQAPFTFIAALLALFCGAAIASTALRFMHKEEQKIRFSSRPANSVGYETFVLILTKDLARATRHQLTGSLALLRLRGLDPITRPEAYQQHDLVTSRLLTMISDNIRQGDTACYLGNLHFMIDLPHTDSAQGWLVLERLREVAACLPQRLCPSLSANPLQWDAVCLEYPKDAATAGELLNIAARTLGTTAQQRIDDLERQRAAAQLQLQRLGSV